MCIGIHPQAQYFIASPFATITAASLLRYVSISLAHLSTVVFANSCKLDGLHWCTSIFKSFHRFSNGLGSGHWLDHSKTFKCFPQGIHSTEQGFMEEQPEKKPLIKGQNKKTHLEFAQQHVCPTAFNAFFSGRSSIKSRSVE